MPDINDIDTRLSRLETAFHDYVTMVVYYDSNENKYRYANIGYCKYYNIPYLPTEYNSAAQAIQAAKNLNTA